MTAFTVRKPPFASFRHNTLDAHYSEENQKSGPVLSPANATLDSQETSGSATMVALLDFSAPRKAPRLPCINLSKSQSMNPDFFGRKEILSELHDVLRPVDQQSTITTVNKLRSFALYGFGGIGKTQIAIQYAYLNVHLYDAILWVQADGPEKLASSFRDIAIDLQLIQGADTYDPVVTRNIVMEWLSKPIRSSSLCESEVPYVTEDLAEWLMIFDNADKPELLWDYWPVNGNGAALVTSRDPSTKKYLHSSSGIDLQPFALEDAATFLERLTLSDSQTQGNRNNSLLLSDRLGGYPLALVQTAAIIRQRDLTIDEMLEHYDKARVSAEFYDTVKISPHDKYIYTLATVWRSEELGDAALHLLELITCLDPDAMAESIIKTQVDQHPSHGFEDMQNSYEEARTSLISASLIKRSIDKKHLIVHRIVQEGVRHSMSSQRFRAVFCLAVQMLLRAWYHDPEEKFTHLNALWDTAKLVSPHATHMTLVFKLQRPYLDPEDRFAFARLLQKNGWSEIPNYPRVCQLTMEGICSRPVIQSRRFHS